MISVIIPVYQQVEYLADAIDSVLDNAPFLPEEIIIVNDGSTDGSLEIARKYEGKQVVKGSQTNVRVIDQVNKGLASARNTGIMNAVGKWCLFLDSDDILKENAIEKISQEISKDNADIIAPSMKNFGINNDTIILMPSPTLEDFKTGNRIPYASAIRKEKLLEVGGYSPKMVEGWEDYHLWFNLLTRGAKIVTIPEPLLLYRTKEKSMYKDSLEYSEKLWAQIKKDFPIW